MAQVPYSAVPSVAPETSAPNDYQKIDARPEQFGALIGRGLQQAGQGAVAAADNLFDISAFHDKINADDQTTHFITRREEILNGVPGKPAIGPDGNPVMGPDGKPAPDRGYFGLESRGASDQRAGVLKQLDDARLEGRKNLTSPQAQLLYDTQTRRMYADAVKETGVHADQQWKVWAGGVNEKGAAQSLNGFVNNLDDPAEMSHHARDYINFQVQSAQLKYGDDPAIKAEVLADAKRSLLKAQTDRIAVTDPARAIGILDKNKNIAGTQYDDMYNRLRERKESQNGQAIGSKYFSVGKSGTLAPSTQSGIAQAAQTYGVNPATLSRTVQIESGGNPKAQTGSYKGMMQLSNAEWQKYKPRADADIWNAADNIAAGAAKMKAEGDAFASRTGHAASAFDSYMIHQQGLGGYVAHVSNPDAPAWQNMASTGEGREKGEAWAKKAIWGNIPDRYKTGFGNVDNVTSRDFINMWASRWGGAQPTFGEAALPQNAARSGIVPAGGPAALAQPATIESVAGTGNEVPTALPVDFSGRAVFAAPPQPPGMAPQVTNVRAGGMQAMLESDDYRNATPNEQAHARAAFAQQANAEEIAENQNTKAKKDASDNAANGFVTAIYDMEHSPQQDWVTLAGKINHDPNLGWEAKRSLMAMVQHSSGEEQSLGFGPAYADTYHRIFLPPDDPNRINDVNDILTLGGPEGHLTPAGANRLVSVFEKSRKEPDQAAVNGTKSSLIQYAKSKLSFDQEFLFPGAPPMRDPKGAQIFNAKFVPKFEAAYDAWTKAGKNPWEFLTQENVDKLMTGMRSQSEMNQARILAEGQTTGEKAATAPALSRGDIAKLAPTPDDVRPETWVPIMAARPVKNGIVMPLPIWKSAIELLRSDPSDEARQSFDQNFGNGAAAKILGAINARPLQAPASPAASAPQASPPPIPAAHVRQGLSPHAAAEAERLAGQARQSGLDRIGPQLAAPIEAAVSAVGAAFPSPQGSVSEHNTRRYDHGAHRQWRGSSQRPALDQNAHANWRDQ